MGLLDRLRRSFQDRAGIPPDQREIGPTPGDIDQLRHALQQEATRLGRTTNLSLSVFLEHTDLDIAALDLYPILNHLVAQRELTNFRQDSFGHAHFDIASLQLPR